MMKERIGDSRIHALLLAVGLLIAGSASTSAADWTSTDVGAVGVAGAATRTAGVWAVSGAGADIWGDKDAFHYLHRIAFSQAYLVVRLDDLENTDPFAKAGLMVRGTLDANAATVILDVKPNREVEFMHRPLAGEQMIYDAGVFVSLPIWLRLSWTATGSTASTITQIVTASVSHDGATWTALGQAPLTSPCCQTMQAGAIVTSHDPGQLNTAHFDGLSTLPSGWSNTDIGDAGVRGSAAVDFVNGNAVWTIDGAGADVWGSADSFHFVHTTTGGPVFIMDYNVLRMEDTDPFAKAGLMVRDGLDEDAVNVILNVKPNNEVEFMARLCTGCETQYLGGTMITLPMDLYIVREGSTFTAYVGQYGGGNRRLVGSVTLPVGDVVERGFVVTSHDPTRTNTAAFDHPPR